VIGEKLDSLGHSALRTTIDQQIEDEIMDAVQFAEESPFPDPSTVMNYAYKE
jgi:TPP-dependent pyruvate/acetoin dehydrogenase alpha subunit